MISWAFAACALIGSWFVFKKMGFPGWKGIIPFYNMYVLFDEVWEKKKFWTFVIFFAVIMVLSVFFAVFLVFAILALVAGNAHDIPVSRDTRILCIVMLVLTIVSAIAMLVMTVLLMVLEFKLYSRLARGFGKGTGFAFGLLFLNPIFMMILGFDKSQYYKFIPAPPTMNN